MLISSLRVDHQYNSPVRSTMLCASMHGVTERHHISILACTDNCYPFFCWQWRNRNRSASLSWRIILLYILIRIYFFLNRGTRQKTFFCFAVKQQWRLLHHQNLQLQQQQRGGGGESCEWRESQGGMDGLATFTRGVVGPWGWLNADGTTPKATPKLRA